MSSRSASDRRTELATVAAQACDCQRCPSLAAERTQVVFGSGDENADLMFVGEAPGAKEDEQGVPFVGAAGKLLAQLLGEIGLSRDDVFIANVLKCRPPGNRDPQPAEIEACQEYLWRQIELIEPKVICTLGNFSTKLLRGDPTGISKIHGQAEVRVLGRRAVRLFPLYHPAAALYTRSMLGTLQEDIARLPELLALDPPAQPAAAVEPEVPSPGPPSDVTGPGGRSDRAEPSEAVESAEQTESRGVPAVQVAAESAPQLGLF